MLDVRSQSPDSQPEADMQHESPSSMKPDFVRLELTPVQRAQVRASTGIDAEAIQLGASELEERIAPYCATGQHLKEG